LKGEISCIALREKESFEIPGRSEVSRKNLFKITILFWVKIYREYFNKGIFPKYGLLIQILLILSGKKSSLPLLKGSKCLHIERKTLLLQASLRFFDFSNNTK